MRALKWIFGLAGLLVTLFVIAVIGVLVFLDPNDYREQIANKVHQDTGRELRIEGDIQFSFFPWLGLELGQLELGNAPGFAEEPFAGIRRADIKVKLLPLLRMQAEVSTIALHGLTLNLHRLADGRSNWDDLAGEPLATPEAPTGPAQAGSSPEQLLEALSIGGVEILDANISWRDELNNQHATLQQFNLRTSEISLTRPISLQSDAQITLNEPEISATYALKSRISLDLANERYRLDDTSLQLDAQSPLLHGGQARLNLAADILADLQQQTASVQNLQLASLGLELKGQLNASNILGEPAAHGQIALLVERVDALSKLLELPDGIDLKPLQGGRLNTDFNLDLATQRLTIQELSLNAAGTELSLQVQAREILADASAAGRFALLVRDARPLGQMLELPEGLKADELTGTRIASQFAVDLGKQELSLRQLDLAALGLELGMQLAITQLLDNPQLSGNLRSNEFVPRQLMGRLGIEAPETADPNTLILARLQTGFAASADHLSLSELQLQLDQSQLSGRFSLRNFDKPVIRYQIALDNIDLDRYLPPPSDEATVVAEAGEAEPVELPLELLRGLDIDGTVRIGQVKVMNLRSDSIVKTLRAERGQFRVHPLQANLYQGNYRGDLRFDVRQDTPKLSMNEHLSGVQAGPLLKDFMGEDYASGTANLSVTMNAEGIEPMQIRRSLNGNGNFSFENGQVKGINIGHVIRQAYALYKGQPAPAEETRETDFALLRGSFTVRNGLLNTRDTMARSPLFEVKAAGDVHLAAETLDLRIDTTIVGSLKDAANQEMSELKGLTLPITVKGSFDSPRIGLDLGSILRARVQQAIDEQKEQVREQVQQRIEQEQDKVQERIDQEKQRLERQLQDSIRQRLRF